MLGRKSVWTAGCLLLLASVWFSARLLEIDYGPLPTGMLKLAAIAVGPGIIGDAAVAFITPFFLLAGITGIVSVFAAAFVIYLLLIGAPLALLFDLEFQEVVTSTVVIVVAKIVACFVTVLMLRSLFG